MSKDKTNTDQSSTKPALPLGQILDLLEGEGYTDARFAGIDVPGIKKDEQFNPAERMKEDPDSLSFAHVLEDSLQDHGIFVGDLLCIDKTASPKTGDLVVSEAGGTVVHRFRHENGIYELQPLNQFLETICSEDPASFGIWGVVKQVMRTFEWDGRPDFHLNTESVSPPVEPEEKKNI